MQLKMICDLYSSGVAALYQSPKGREKGLLVNRVLPPVTNLIVFVFFCCFYEYL